MVTNHLIVFIKHKLLVTISLSMLKKNTLPFFIILEWYFYSLAKSQVFSFLTRILTSDYIRLFARRPSLVAVSIVINRFRENATYTSIFPTHSCDNLSKMFNHATYDLMFLISGSTIFASLSFLFYRRESPWYNVPDNEEIALNPEIKE